MNGSDMQQERIEPTWHQAPLSGKPDPHTEGAGETLAIVGVTAASTLKQIFEEALDTLGDPNADATAKAKARARLSAGLEFNTTIADAQNSFAQGRTAQARLFSQPRRGWRETTTPDELAATAAKHFEQAQERLVQAGDAMGREPLLAPVLEKAGQSIDNFFGRIGRTAVTLKALASRALEIPGMVRTRLESGIHNAGDAVQNALEEFHTKTGERVEAMKQRAGQVATRAWTAVADTGAEIATNIKNEALDVRDDILEVRDRGVQAFERTKVRGIQAVDNVKNQGVQAIENAKAKGRAVRNAGQLAVDTAGAVVDVVDDTVLSPLGEWLRNTAAPAIKAFGSEFLGEVKQRTAARQDGRQANMADLMAARRADKAPAGPRVTRERRDSASL